MLWFPPEHFVNKKVTVMGLGHFGGQIAAVKFLVAQGAEVTVTDIASSEKLEPALKEIAHLPVVLHLGGHIEADFTDCDLVVVSPAVPKDSRYLKLAAQNGIPLTCEMNLFLDRCRAEVIGVTGTVGKSTTVAMLASILAEVEKSELERLRFERFWVGGNIGRSLLEDVCNIGNDDLVVLELSSFQLEDMASIEYSPHVAVVTNIFPNHLDRHTNLRQYIEAKRNITAFQSSGDFLILNGDDSNCKTLEESAPGNLNVWKFGRHLSQGGEQRVLSLTEGPEGWELRCNLVDQIGPIITSEELPVPGYHNMENAACAAAAALAVGISRTTIARGLRAFKGLSDRLELVAEADNIRWYNDSKSTTPESGIVALRAFAPNSAVAVVGGYDKGLDLNEFAEVLAERSKVTICMGQTGPALAEAIRQSGGHAIEVDTMEAAVREASKRVRPGECVLLSPGCASWDMFENYQARGKCFRKLVHALVKPLAVK